jgi:hypothetical protein
MKIESLAGLGVIKVECGSQFSVALTRYVCVSVFTTFLDECSEKLTVIIYNFLPF